MSLKLTPKQISISDCIHLKTAQLVCASRWTGDGESGSYKVWLCDACGQFRVNGFRNGEAFEVDFALNGLDLLRSAAKHVEYVLGKEVEITAK